MELGSNHTDNSTGVGPAPSVLPEVQDGSCRENSHTGVSTRSTLFSNTPPQKKEEWFVLKTTYSREQKACDYLASKQILTFYPTVTTVREVNGKRKKFKESRLPNLFFAYGTERELTPLVQQNPEVPFLRYYCRYRQESGEIRREIIRVPQRQMDSLMKICQAENSNALLLPGNIHKFEKGQLVRVTEGEFKGVEGIVARFKGEQRVGIIIDGLLTAATAYIPSAFLEEINKTI